MSSSTRVSKHVELDAMHDTLRDRICLRVYAPGTLLRETELAAEFGVSRTPVREVLQRLGDLGLVEVRNGVGTLVRAFAWPELRDIYELRLQVAMLMGQLSPLPCTPREVSAIGELRREARALRHETGLPAYWRINHRLHFVIGGLIGNHALLELWDKLYFQVASTWYGCAEDDFGGVTAALRRELDEVLAALREGDVAALGFVQRNHIAAGLRRVRARLQPAAGEDAE